MRRARIAFHNRRLADLNDAALIVDGWPSTPEAYRDESWPERACDYCGKLYRGPAVYCSLECAVDDA